MRVRILILVTAMLACLMYPARSIAQPLQETVRDSEPTDFNKRIYYKNKLELSFETGWLPNNIPFVFDFLLGSGFKVTGLNYTLVPNIASVRWQMDNIGGPWILRGNWDLSLSGAVTSIPRGPETHYGA